MPHLQDSINKSPVQGTMQHQCHYIPTPARLHEQVAGTGDYATQNATPTRLNKQVAGVGDYATPMPHLQDSTNKSPVWGTMQHKCHTYKTRYTSRRCGGLCNTTYPHLQDSMNKSPVWGTMQHYIPTPTRLDKQVAGVGDYVPLHTHTYKSHLQVTLTSS